MTRWRERHFLGLEQRHWAAAAASPSEQKRSPSLPSDEGRRAGARREPFTLALETLDSISLLALAPPNAARSA
jgi:hypothetical protein